MSWLLNTGRGLWFGAGVVVGLALAALLPWSMSFLLDLIQALDFALAWSLLLNHGPQ